MITIYFLGRHIWVRGGDGSNYDCSVANCYYSQELEVGRHLDCHIRLSHIQEAGRKYCSAFVTLVFIFSLPFTAT